MADPTTTAPGPGKNYPVKLAGGPCGGRTLQLSGDQLNAGWAMCQGRLYLYAPDTVSPYIFQFAPDQAKGKPVAPSYTTSDVFTAFHSLMYTLGHRVPAGVTRIRGDLQRIRKAVG